jgi:hypothetical protein
VSAWQLVKATLKLYRRHLRILIGTVAVVAVPVAIISGYLIDPTADTTLSAYLTFAQLIMNAAAIYAVVELLSSRPTSVKLAYYRGSGVLVRLILLSLLLVVLLLPLVLGLLILIYGVVAPGAVLSGGEKALMVLFAILAALPGVWLLARGFWSLYIIFETEQGPWQALRSSWRLSKGKARLAVGRAAMLVLMLLGLLLIPAAALIALSTVTGSNSFYVLLQIVVALVVLPVSNLYLYRYYQELKS